MPDTVFVPMIPQPSPLGLKKSFGFGDRLGLATPGHYSSSAKFDFAPIFAQQSIREMTRTQRTPAEVMAAAAKALSSLGFAGAWGADADHLKTPEDVQYTAAAGFTFFTIDPSEFVNNEADVMRLDALRTAADALVPEVFDSPDWTGLYVSKTFDLAPNFSLTIREEELLRAAVKYGRAIAHCARMGLAIREACAGRPFEIEVSVDETDAPTSPVDHLFFGLELKRRGVPVVSLAPRFIGDFEKGIDYKGDLAAFERTLNQHVAIAQHCGPYKISIHSGSDKFSAYPAIGRVCGDLLHVKTAGTSYLEALRAVLRTSPALFQEIKEYCIDRFSTDRKSYHISTTDEEAAAAAKRTDVEAAMLDERPGRQLLHVTFGSVLTAGTAKNGRTFKAAIMEVLETNSELHRSLLEAHFDKHLSLLCKG